MANYLAPGPIVQPRDSTIDEASVLPPCTVMGADPAPCRAVACRDITLDTKDMHPLSAGLSQRPRGAATPDRPRRGLRSALWISGNVLITDISSLCRCLAASAALASADAYSLAPRSWRRRDNKVWATRPILQFRFICSSPKEHALCLGLMCLLIL